jgi:hypothetical protein
MFNTIKNVFSSFHWNTKSKKHKIRPILEYEGEQPNVISSSNPFNFCLHHAEGGYVLHFSTYNRTTDESVTKLYIITDKEDIGQKIAHILTIQALRS